MTYLDELFSLENKIAIVTGAARGNGLAISTSLLKAGCKVILVDINANQLKNISNNSECILWKFLHNIIPNLDFLEPMISIM